MYSEKKNSESIKWNMIKFCHLEHAGIFKYANETNLLKDWHSESF